MVPIYIILQFHDLIGVMMTEAKLPMVDISEARRQAFADLANFFDTKKDVFTASDVEKIVQMVNRTSPIKPLQPDTVMKSVEKRVAVQASHRKASSFLTTPLPRRAAARESLGKSMGGGRSMTLTGTQFRFRSRPMLVEPTESTILPVIEDNEVEQEILKSTATTTEVKAEIPRSPKKTQEEVVASSQTVVEEEPIKAAIPEKRPPKNRFTGVFYLDSDEEEQELLEQERKVEERRKRIQTLVAKKEQREKVVAFRLSEPSSFEAPKEVEPVKVAPQATAAKPLVAVEKPELLFDFSSVATPVIPAPEQSKTEAPLISLGTPSKPIVELPSATTKLSSTPVKKRKSIPDIKESSSFTFNPNSTTFNVPAESKVTSGTGFTFNFGTPTTKESEESKFAFKPSTEVSKPSMATETKPAFSFGPPPTQTLADTKKEEELAKAPTPAFTFGSSASKEEGVKPSFAFTFGAKKEEPSTPSTAAPLFSFGTSSSAKANEASNALPNSELKTEAMEEKELPKFNFNFGSPVAASSTAAQTAEVSKPSFTFGLPSTSVASVKKEEEVPAAPKIEEVKSTFTFGSTATPAPTFNFGSTTANTSKTSAFNFGTASSTPTTTEPAKPFLFGSSAPATTNTTAAALPTFNFGAPSTTSSMTPSFGKATSSFTFGSSAAEPTADTSMNMMESSDMMMDSSSNNAPASSNFTFGSSNGNAFGNSPTPTFSFGQSASIPSSTAAAAASTTPFQFNMPSLNTQPPTIPSTFNFVQPTGAGPTDAPFVFGAAPAAGGFNAGTAAKKPTGPITAPRRRR